MGLSKDILSKLLNNQQLLDEKKGVTGLAKLLKADLSKGLTDKQVQVNRETYGPNVLPEIESKSFFDLIIEGLEDKTLRMLSVAAGISLFLGMREDPETGWIEGAAIILAVCIVVLVVAFNDYEKEKQFRSLNAKKDLKNIKVVRNGEKTEVLVSDIVVGDVVLIDTGDIFCSDGVYINGDSLLIDESSSTGESDSKKKGNMEGHDPFFMSGTKCLDGVGRMLVICTGEFSFLGQNMMSLREESGDTPLQEKLNDLADDIGLLGIGAAVVMFLTLSLRDVFVMYQNDNLVFDEQFANNLVKYVVTSITILVVAIPEGLPLAVTMALAYSMVKMLEDNNLVRKLEACETMGSATNICSDKTGTLTQNKMTVVRGMLGNQEFGNVDEIVSDMDSLLVEMTCEGVAVNTTAFRKPGETEFVGSKTEAALLNFGKTVNGVEYDEYRRNADIVHIYPFSSTLKQMRTIVRLEDGSLRMYVKGASEIVLNTCKNYVTIDGAVKSITKAKMEVFSNTIDGFAEDALRTIGLAYVDLVDSGMSKADYQVSPPQGPLVLIGIVGIEDPLRPEVSESVATCKKAGINVRMVTGDNIITARNIALKCGIYDGNEKGCMEGPEYRKLKGTALKKATQNLQVLARSSPLDKKILVETLKSLGEVVAVTGDGSNDGPALKNAHVGFSMGIAGTDIAIEASDIVLMDDNFSSIVKAILWGRNVFDSIRKFIQFQLTVNIAAVILAFCGSLTDEHGQSPLKPVQLLWVNLIMDTLAALALATEAPHPSLLDRPPYGSDRGGLITRTMWKNILGQACFQLVMNFVLLYRPDCVFDGVTVGSTHHLTIFFNTFVLCQLFNELNCRKINGEFNIFSGLLGNKVFILVMVGTLAMQYGMVQYGGDFAGCVSLSEQEWIKCIAIGALSLPVGFILNCIPIKNKEITVNKLHQD